MNKQSTIIIAEAGVNHNGSIDTAKKMIDVAAEAGADYVKFQTFKAETLVTKTAEKAEYQKSVTDKSDTHYNMLKKLELDKSAHFKLIKYCKQKNIRFLSTAFDIESIELLAELEIPIFKIPSGEITNLPYLAHIGKIKKPIIMSTGMSTSADINSALDILFQAGLQKDQITLLHCNTEYPTPMKDVNLKAMITIEKKFGVNIGYSDHTLGIEVPIAAVAMGAKVIEKHFTLDKEMSGPDHLASLEPHELKAMVDAIRNIERAMGDGKKRISKSERKNIPIVRKSIVAKKQINKGDLFTNQNLTVKRPGTGISPMEWDSIIGTVVDRDYQKDDLIK